MPRFKLAFQVVVGELKGQGIRVTSKCLWDPTTDNYSSHYFYNVIYILHLKKYFKLFIGKYVCCCHGIWMLF